MNWQSIWLKYFDDLFTEMCAGILCANGGMCDRGMCICPPSCPTLDVPQVRRLTTDQVGQWSVDLVLLWTCQYAPMTAWRTRTSVQCGVRRAMLAWNCALCTRDIVALCTRESVATSHTSLKVRYLWRVWTYPQRRQWVNELLVNVGRMFESVCLSVCLFVCLSAA